MTGKRNNNNPIKHFTKITSKLFKAAYNSYVTKSKLDEYPLQRRVYLLNFINYPKIILSQFQETYMMLMKYSSIREEDLPDYYSKATWNILHEFMDEHSQRLI